MVQGMESEYVEGVLSKISRFFNTKRHKITTVYTPDQTVTDLFRPNVFLQY
jgi:hypothetical protein